MAPRAALVSSVLVFAIAFAMMAAGLVIYRFMGMPYISSGMISRFWPWELLLAGIALMLARWCVPARHLDEMLQLPDARQLAWQLPLLLAVAVGIAGLIVGGLYAVRMPGLIVPYLTTLLLALLVGFTEELLFRGIILNLLRGAFPLWLAVGGSALLFGLFHLANVAGGQTLEAVVSQAIYTTVVGVFFALSVLPGRNLWPAVVAHAIYDAALMCAAILGPSGPNAAGFGAGFVQAGLVMSAAVFGLRGAAGWLRRPQH